MDFKEFFRLDDAELQERIVKKKVIRKGKRIIKFTSDKPNMKVVIDPKTGSKSEVRVSAAEKLKRKKGAKKGARKSKSKRAMSNKKRARSLKKRKGLGTKTSF